MQVLFISAADEAGAMTRLPFGLACVAAAMNHLDKESA
jgi:hypothetical protein